MADVFGLPGDVYFGDAEKPLPDWRKEDRPHSGEDDAEPTAVEIQGVVGILGFDPRELYDDEG